MALVEQNRNGENATRLSEASASDYIALLKPRVMSLVVFTGFVGLLVAPGHMNPVLAAIAILCIAVGAGASGALNMWYDADIDAVMKRTRNRPIPAGIVSREEVLVFGLVLSAFSVMTLGLLVNWLSAALLAFTIFFYVVVYSMWLKRSTPQNIVIGGAAGAFPPMIGWAAATGAIGWESVVLFLIIFLWTPPHFWALSLFTTNDYAAARVPMMPNVRGEASTKLQILVYTLIVSPVGVLPWVMGFAGPVYGIVSAALGLAFIIHAWLLWRAPSGEAALKPARSLFGFSLLYLFGLFAVLLGETLAQKALLWIGA
ncbi:protoheme IX farnesyltransferase [Phyllobacterium phragmitis]|uniref:Protoheme IX farnesyltransferase n=1 Tax=Phyllobacterium phragmitis TaxID=2670329 RepID=A0A2S9IYW1_9HYPH|nr:heme o synthase [Phyllobacterium phragmitis]PRD45715.1 protoheme IX farnesyltransferase [Phyllobacterium phragmitis]